VFFLVEEHLRWVLAEGHEGVAGLQGSGLKNARLQDSKRGKSGF